MKKLHPLLTVLFLTFWGCEGILNSYDEHFGSTVNLWGEEYSVKNTTVLNLSSNQLTGSIPPEIGNLTNLEILYLNDNQLTSQISPEIGNLTNLEYLKLNDNQLTGEIPSEIGNLYNLDVLFLDNNQLSGIIPNEICLRGLTWYLTLGSTRTKSSVSNNQLCHPYPSCVEDYVGVQDTTNCD